MRREATGCWEWTGYRVAQGYGRFSTGAGKCYWAHRYSWEVYFGEIPEGRIVRHRCNNKACVNPGHLVLGTHEENMRDVREAKKGAIRLVQLEMLDVDWVQMGLFKEEEEEEE